MNIHKGFYDFLRSLPEADEITGVYHAYKLAEENFAYELNGYLKSGLPLRKELNDQRVSLQKLFRARNSSPITLYRGTSDAEFAGPLLPIILQMPVCYPAFLSTTRTASCVEQFIPSSGRPLILEIHCPPWTVIAPMEGNSDGLEDEYLLGCGTTFNVGACRQLDPGEIEYFLGRRPFEGQDIFHLKLTVLKNPGYIADETFYDFTPPQNIGPAA